MDILLFHVYMQVGEAQLVDLLEKLSQHTQKKTTIKVHSTRTIGRVCVHTIMADSICVQFERKRLDSDEDF